MQTKLCPKCYEWMLVSFTALLLVIAMLLLCASKLVYAQPLPSIDASGLTCQPGSIISVSGVNFAPDISATVSINAHQVGTITTQADGGLAFLIEYPSRALSATYTLAVSTTVVVTDTFKVSYDAPTCLVALPVDEDGQVIILPTVYLPDLGYYHFLPWLSHQ